MNCSIEANDYEWMKMHPKYEFSGLLASAIRAARERVAEAEAGELTPQAVAKLVQERRKAKEEAASVLGGLTEEEDA